MEERRLVGGAPEAFSEETPVALPEFRRPGSLVLIDRLPGVAGIEDIVQLEIGIGRDPNRVRMRGIGSETRQRQVLPVEIDAERLGGPEP